MFCCLARRQETTSSAFITCHIQKFSDHSAVAGCISEGAEDEYSTTVKENLTMVYFLQFICYRSLCFSAEKYSSPNRWRFASPSSLLSSIFLFLTGDDNSAFCQELKSPYFPRILNFVWNSSILVAQEFFPIWSRLQISWRRLVTKDAGVISDQTTCRAKILQHGVLQNTWIRGKKATYLDNGQMCLAVVNYTKITEAHSSEWNILQH